MTICSQTIFLFICILLGQIASHICKMLSMIFFLPLQGGEVFKETITANISDDSVMLEFPQNDGTYISQLIDFKQVWSLDPHMFYSTTYVATQLYIFYCSTTSLFVLIPPYSNVHLNTSLAHLSCFSLSFSDNFSLITSQNYLIAGIDLNFFYIHTNFFWSFLAAPV